MKVNSIKNEEKEKMLLNASSTEKMVFKELQKMGFSVRNVGTIYAMEVVAQLIIVMFTADYTERNWRMIVDSVAKKHDTTWHWMNERIKWTIDKTMEEGNINYIYDVLGENFEELHGYGARRTRYFLTHVAKKVKDDASIDSEQSIEIFRKIVKNRIDNATLPTLEMIYGITKYNAITEKELIK